jgi:hypothetical protein
MKKVLLFLALALCAPIAVAGPAFAATAFQRVGAFNEAFPDGVAASHQHRIAVNDGSGDIYVTDAVNNQVAVFHPNGSGADALTTFGSGDVTDPFGIAVDQSTGDVYVADDNDVVKYTSDGAPTPTFTKDNTFTSPGVTGALAFDQGNHQLLVADTATNTIRRYSTTGTAGTTFDGSAGTGSPGAFTGVQDLAVDSTGDVIVIDSNGDPAQGTGTSRVERYGANGAWEATVGAVTQAATLAARPDTDELIVSTNQDAAGQFQKAALRVFGPTGDPGVKVTLDDSALYSIITGVASDDGPTGQLFVATDNGPAFPSFGYVSVQVYTPFVADRPAVSIATAQDVIADRATLRGQVDPNRLDTTYYFEYGTTTAYGRSLPGTRDASVGNGEEPRAVSRSASELAPGTTYHFRVVAHNELGTSMSADQTFTTTGEAVADACPNAPIRAQQGSAGLKDCRAYEQVSPAEKAGYPVAYGNGHFMPLPMAAASRSGDTAVFVSFGAFAGQTHSAGPLQYRAVRTAAGWATKPAGPAPTVAEPDFLGGQGMSAWATATPDLSTGIVFTNNQWSSQDLNTGVPAGNDIYTSMPGRDETALQSTGSDGQALGDLVSPGFVVSTVGISADGAHTVFVTASPGVVDDTDNGLTDVFEHVNGVTRRVSVFPEGSASSPACAGASLPFIEGGGSGGRGQPESALSGDGSKIVFMTPDLSGATSPCPDPRRLWVRINGTETREVSASRRTVPDPGGPRPAVFVGASKDGSKILFNSYDALLDGAVPGTGGIYQYDVDTDQLTLPLPDVATLAAMSDDAQTLYYTQPSDGALGRLRNGQRTVVVPGANVFSSSTLTNPDGSSVLFVTAADLGFNSGGRQQVYLVRGDEPLRCLSCTTGAPPTAGEAVISEGSAGGFNDNGKYGSSLSDDGSRVVFQTPYALLPTDRNNRDDIYLWNNGKLSLVTPGTTADEAQLLGMSKDGRDIFFVTSQSLVPQDDDDGDADLYDARVDGGFALPDAGAAAPTCDGDDCQGARSGVPAVVAPGSAVPGRPDAAPVARPSFGVRMISIAQRRAAARSGILMLSVTTNRAGTINAAATATLSKRRTTVASTKVSPTKAGTAKVALRLSSAARKALSRSGRLALRVELRFTGVSIPKALKVTLAKAVARRATAPSTSSRKAR